MPKNTQILQIKTSQPCLLNPSRSAHLRQNKARYVGIVAADAGEVAATTSSQYVQPLAEGFQAGRGTFLSLLHYVTEESRSKSCLSYYYVRLVETFDLYKRLVTDMERVHVDSLRHYDEINDSDTAKEAVLRELQSLEVYESKRDELDSILSFAKYKLKDNLELEHDNCSGIGHHCIKHGLDSCTHKDHDKECSDCSKFLRCTHNLKQFLQLQYNDLCRASEYKLPEWVPRGQSVACVEVPKTVPNLVTTEGNMARKKWHTCNAPDCTKKRFYALPIGVAPHDFTCAHGRDPTKSHWCLQTQPAWFAGRNSVAMAIREREVECTHCGARRVVPANVDDKHLFLDWHCSIRTWCKGPQQSGYQEFRNCNDGRTNSRLIRAHLAALVEESTQDIAPISETATPAAISMDSGTDELQEPTSEPPQKKRKNDPFTNSSAEGAMRTRMRDLLEMVGFVAYVPEWYAAHTARGKWQEREIKNMKAALYVHEEKVALFTIDI
jgi:hypothetical protein